MGQIERIRRVLLITLALNMTVAGAKVLCGYLVGSVSMVADGFHSFFDGVSNIVGLLGLWISSKPPDTDHPYGHRKYETLSTVAISVMMFLTSLEVLERAFSGFGADHHTDASPAAFAVMLGTLAVNVGVTRYEKRKGEELRSDFLLADSMHTRSDLYVTGAVLVSLICARAGFPRVDPVIAIFITFMIARMGLKVLKSASDILVDTVMLQGDRVKDIAMLVPGVMGAHRIRTRGREDQIWLDLHVFVAPETRTDAAHDIVHAVIDRIREAIPEVVDVVVHVEPYFPLPDQ